MFLPQQFSDCLKGSSLNATVNRMVIVVVVVVIIIIVEALFIIVSIFRVIVV